MADEAQLSQALINADKAGDTAAAQMLAGEIQKLRAASPPPEATELGGAIAANGPVGNKPDQSYTSNFLPFSVDKRGNLDWDVPGLIKGLYASGKEAVTLPGRVLKNEVDPMSDEGVKGALNIASMASPLSAGTRAGAQVINSGVSNYKQAVPKVPTAEALKEAAKAGYDTAKKSGVEYSSAAVGKMAGDIQRALETDGVIAELSPKTFTILGKLGNPPEGSVATLEGLDAARKALGHAAGDFTNPTEQFAARKALEQLDGFVEAADPASVVAGAATTARDAIKGARGNYAAASRSDRVTGLEDAADLNAAASNSGQNIGNSLRQRIASVLKSDKVGRGFNEEELDAARQVVEGTPTRNAARKLANLLGGGGGMGAAIYGLTGAAGSVANPGMAAVAGLPIVGAGLKALENGLTKREVAALDELVRSRSPLYESMKKNAPWEADTPDKRAALARALAASSLDKESN